LNDERIRQVKRLRNLDTGFLPVRQAVKRQAANMPATLPVVDVLINDARASLEGPEKRVRPRLQRRRSCAPAHRTQLAMYDELMQILRRCRDETDVPFRENEMSPVETLQPIIYHA
jgi:hypothetical protein